MVLIIGFVLGFYILNIIFKYKMLLNKMAKGKSAKSAMMYELSFYLDVGEKKYSDHYKINDTEVFDEMGANVSVDISWAYNKEKEV